MVGEIFGLTPRVQDGKVGVRPRFRQAFQSWLRKHRKPCSDPFEATLAVTSNQLGEIMHMLEH